MKAEIEPLRQALQIVENPNSTMFDMPRVAGLLRAKLSQESQAAEPTIEIGKPRLKRAWNTPRQDSQHVLKAEAARPDATDRENPANASPVGGPMGAGQPAAAGPIEESLKRAYYYDESGKWRGSTEETDEWTRWHAVAKVAQSGVGVDMALSSAGLRTEALLWAEQVHRLLPLLGTDCYTLDDLEEFLLKVALSPQVSEPAEGTEGKDVPFGQHAPEPSGGGSSKGGA